MRHTSGCFCSHPTPPPPHRLNANDIISMMKTKHTHVLASCSREGKKLTAHFGVHAATLFIVERGNYVAYSGQCFLEATDAYNA